MQSTPLFDNEAARLAELRRYRILDTPPEASFDRITRIVAEVLGVPIALVSLVDESRQWFKSHVGLDATETPRDVSFCRYTILSHEPLVIEDALQDPRFADNPLVVGSPLIRFYAGAPLTSPEGHNLGSLCAIDTQPRKLAPGQVQLLRDLSQLVVDEMELRLALRRTLEQVANEATQRNAMGDFLSYASHEIRTPLTAIKGSLDMLEHGVLGELPPQALEFVKVAAANSRSLLRLINDLLEAQQVDTHKLTYEFRITDSKMLIEETLASMQTYAADKELTLVTRLGNLPNILADPGRIRQALLNLMSNAFKFSPPKSRVIIKAEDIDHRILIEVTNFGAAIPEDIQAQMFQKFTRSTDAGNIKGSGLGLAISKTIVEAHGGNISFISTPEHGTTFRVMLPENMSMLTLV